MFKDTITLTQFALFQIQENKIKEDACKEIYDVYRHLHVMREKMHLILNYLSREIDFSDTTTSFESPTDKWVFFINKDIRAYEDLKYKLFCILSRLEVLQYPERGVLQSNFLSKALNCKVDEYTRVSHINEELQLVLYQFNLIKEDCPKYRRFEELFTKLSVDVSSADAKRSVIEEALADEKNLEALLNEFEQILQERCSIQNLFVTKELEGYRC
jgi:hypothetical protein